MRAVIYCRVSTEDQAAGYSLVTQLAACREYAAARGYTIVAEYQDEFTGTTLERPGFSQLRQLAERGGCAAVVVYDSSRLGRKLVLILLAEEELRRHGAPVEYVREPADDTPEGAFMAQVRGAVSELERAKILERTSRGRRGRALAGHVWVGIHAPYGYRYVRAEHGGRLEVADDEAQVVRQIFDWYTSGDETGQRLSYDGIARRLTAERVPTKSDLDGHGRKRTHGYAQWSPGHVGDILRNDIYAGRAWFNRHRHTTRTRFEHRPESEWIPIAVPAIIADDTLEAAHRQARNNRNHARRNVKRVYLLRSRFRCEVCDRAINGWPHASGRLYYRCGGQAPQQWPDRERRCTGYLRADRVDAAVWDRLREALSTPGALVAIASTPPDDSTAQAARARLAGITRDLVALDSEQSRLYDAYITLATMPRDEYQRRMTDMQRRRDSLIDERWRLEPVAGTQHNGTTVAADIETACSELAGRLANATAAQRLAIIERLDLRATLAPDRHTIHVSITIGSATIPLVPVVIA